MSQEAGPAVDTFQLSSPEKSFPNPDYAFYYFIGRLTPPHEGHIKALIYCIEKATQAITLPVLFLFGDAGGKRTQKNPISHDKKCAFVEHKLNLAGYIKGRDYYIEIIGTAGGMHQVYERVSHFLVNLKEHGPLRINVIQIAGDKGDDLEKHGILRNLLCEKLKNTHPTDEFKCSYLEAPLTEMDETLHRPDRPITLSATEVRLSAIRIYEDLENSSSAGVDIPNAAYEIWLTEIPYYSTDKQTRLFSRALFDEIILHRNKPPFDDGRSHVKKHNVKIFSAKRAPGPSKKPKPDTADTGGSRRRHRSRIRTANTQRRVSRLRNKKTLRNIRRRSRQHSRS